MWVRSAYTSELAVLAAWLSLLVPWTVTYFPNAALNSNIYFIRFPLFEVQIRQPASISFEELPDSFEQQLDSAAPILADTYPGTELFGDVFLATPVGAAQVYDGSLQTGSLVWGVGALAFAAALALSLALYVRTEWTTEQLPVTDVRLMGALLGVGTLCHGLATGLYYQGRDTVGIPVPVGVIVVGTLAVILLQTESRPGEGASDPADTSPADDEPATE